MYRGRMTCQTLVVRYAKDAVIASALNIGTSYRVKNLTWI